MNAADVVGYAYDADVHCVACAQKRFRGDPGRGHALATTELHGVDEEGNEISPIFAGEDAYEDCAHCQGEGTIRCAVGHPCEHECSSCDGSGQQVRHCGDCNEPLFE